MESESIFEIEPLSSKQVIGVVDVACCGAGKCKSTTHDCAGCPDCQYEV